MSETTGLCALLVDDDAFVRTLLKRFLGRLSVAPVLEAEDGHSALELLRLQAEQGVVPDVILCDLNMRPMGGAEFIRSLHALENPALRGLPVLVLTSDGTTATVQQLVRLGIEGYLLKPVSFGALQERLAAIAERKRVGVIDAA